MKTLINIILFLLVSLAPVIGHSTIIDLTLESQLHQKGVGLNLFEDLEFVTHGFYGMQRQKLTGKGVNIAIIDSGVNFDSPYLSDNILFPETKFDIGFDDNDHGYDFLDENFYPHDEFGSGTHSAGIIQSIAKEVNIIPIKVHDEYRSAEVTHVFSAIKYAIHRGAKIVKFSLERMSHRAQRRQLLHLLQEAGYLNNENILFVVSGVAQELSVNTGFPILSTTVLPDFFNFNANNILSVCAVDNQGKSITPIRIKNSNEADVCALGKDVYSISVNGITMEKRDGSDVAAGFVSALAALLFQIQEGLTSSQVKNLIKGGVVQTPELKPYSRSGGYISIDKTLEKILK